MLKANKPLDDALQHVIDGGALLYCIPLCKRSTYDTIAQSYVAQVMKEQTILYWGNC